MVIPPSITNTLKPSDHIFPEYIKSYLETSIQDLQYSEKKTFEEARRLGYTLRRNNNMSQYYADKTRN